MSLVLINEFGTVAKYPYSKAQMRADHPHVSFADNPSAESLAELNVYPVTVVTPDHDSVTQKVVRANAPELVDGQWTLTNTIEDRSAEEIAANARAVRDRLIKQFEQENEAAYHQHARETRMGLTPSVDVAPLDAYIQELADWPDSAGFPDLSTLPEPPA